VLSPYNLALRVQVLLAPFLFLLAHPALVMVARLRSTLALLRPAPVDQLPLLGAAVTRALVVL
jgi:hypothetical protein